MFDKKNNSTKFIFFSHQTLQVPRVAMQCMVALCEAVAQLGADSEIVSFASEVHPSEPKHPLFEELYGIESPIIHSVYSLFINRNSYIHSNNSKFLLESQRLLVYFIHILRFILKGGLKRYKHVIVCSRNFSILGMLVLVKKILRRKMIVLSDLHYMPNTRIKRWVLKIVDGNVCISRSLAEVLMGKLNLPSEKVKAIHNGVKIERFIFTNETKEMICTRHNLLLDQKIICYTGKVYYRYKEIDYLLQVAEKLSSDSIILIVGGRPDHVMKWQAELIKRNLRNVVFQHFVPPSEIPAYLKAADLLVLYYPPIEQIDYISPTKLFEYLASGVPVVASRSKSIEEIISDGKDGFLVEPYKPHLLAERINEIIEDKELLERVGRNGRKRAEQFTLHIRAQCFLDFGRSVALSKK